MSNELILKLLKQEVERLRKALEKQEAAVSNDPATIMLNCLAEADQCLKDCRAGKITDVERDIKMKSLHEKNEIAKMRLKTFNPIKELDKLNQLKLELMNAERECSNTQFGLTMRKMGGRDATET